ncbi:MAG TPA: hypothetical protein ENJ95_02775, partial [Bacteroidetes bacterium]|nr:hypothetical protein [Bacteroidota bacterium]
MLKIDLKWAVPFLALAGLLLLPVLLPGQSIRDTLFEEIRIKLEPMIASLESPGLEAADEYNLYVADAVLSLKDENLELVNKDPVYDLKMRELEQDWGINIRSQVNHNFEQQFFDIETIDQQLTPLRARVGLEWNILKDGLLAHQNRIQRLKNEKEIDWLRFDKKKNKERLFYRYNVLIYYFNLEKIKLLKKRKASLEQQLELLFKIYYVRDIMFEEIIAMKGQLEQVEVQLKNYIDYNALMESTVNISGFPIDIEVDRLPVLDLDVDKMLKDSVYMTRDDRSLLLEKENMYLKNAAVNDISLRVQLYQNFGFSDPKTPDRTYTSAGISASIPLEKLYQGKVPDQLIGAQALEREHFAKYEDLNSATEIVNYYYEFNYKLKTYVEFLYKYMLYEEKLRVEQVDRVHFTDFYQPFRILKYHENLRQIKLELLDLKQQMYLFLLKMYSKTNLKSIQPYLIPVSSGQYFSRLPASRTIFMDASDFKKYDRRFIENYLRFNDFNYAILRDEGMVDISDGKRETAFSKQAGLRLIKTTPWNSAQTDIEKTAARTVEMLDRGGYAGFMLNIHEADIKGTGWLGIENLVGKLQGFFISCQNRRPNTAIFLNVPAGFPLQELSKLSGWTEKVILRLEDQNDLDAIRELPKKLLPFQNLPICISLNVSQFKDRLKLEAYLNQILKDQRINDVV